MGRGGEYENGIAVSTARELAKNRRVTMVNLAVSGARTEDVLDDQLGAAAQARSGPGVGGFQRCDAPDVDPPHAPHSRVLFARSVLA